MRQYGLEPDDLARMVNVAGRKMTPKLEGTVSDTLMYILETSKKPRTHPRIADAIATVCHATPEQRDSIVDERHRGTRGNSKKRTTNASVENARRKAGCDDRRKRQGDMQIQQHSGSVKGKQNCDQDDWRNLQAQAEKRIGQIQIYVSVRGRMGSNERQAATTGHR